MCSYLKVEKKRKNVKEIKTKKFFKLLFLTASFKFHAVVLNFTMCAHIYLTRIKQRMRVKKSISSKYRLIYIISEGSMDLIHIIGVQSQFKNSQNS